MSDQRRRDEMLWEYQPQHPSQPSAGGRITLSRFIIWTMIGTAGVILSTALAVVVDAAVKKWLAGLAPPAVEESVAPPPPKLAPQRLMSIGPPVIRPPAPPAELVLELGEQPNRYQGLSFPSELLPDWLFTTSEVEGSADDRIVALGAVTVRMVMVGPDGVAYVQDSPQLIKQEQRGKAWPIPMPPNCDFYPALVPGEVYTVVLEIQGETWRQGYIGPPMRVIDPGVTAVDTSRQQVVGAHMALPFNFYDNWRAHLGVSAVAATEAEAPGTDGDESGLTGG